MKNLLVTLNECTNLKWINHQGDELKIHKSELMIIQKDKEIKFESADLDDQYCKLSGGPYHLNLDVLRFPYTKYFHGIIAFPLSIVVDGVEIYPLIKNETEACIGYRRNDEFIIKYLGEMRRPISMLMDVCPVEFIGHSLVFNYRDQYFKFDLYGNNKTE